LNVSLETDFRYLLYLVNAMIVVVVAVVMETVVM